MFHEGQAQICGSNRGKEMLEEKKINATPNYAVTIHLSYRRTNTTLLALLTYM